MNKSELVNIIAKKVSITKNLAHRTLDAAIDSISEALQNGDSVTLVGFGSFQVRHRIAREGRNPKTGAKMMIKASKSPTFKAGKSLKDYIN